ncbi:hypothetical protein C8J57DRAFT_598725 [Mycena rebaudengoi]|nr:hypothetical protein C8J57DRAFT_598725 [Mycena rebaudengoi]
MVPNTPPSFPPELEREMFEMAATEHPNMMPTLVLVAHRVLQWIEPLLYRTLLLMQDSPRDKTALLLAIQRTPAKFTKYVQNLLVWPGEASPHDECAMLLISLCSGISRLALFDPKPTMLPALDNMRLDHLSVSLAILFGHSSNPGEINPDRPLFQALTHLCLWDDSRMIDGLPIAKLPALTHLCVNGRQDSLFLLSTLRNCAQFRVLVHMYWTRVALGRAQQTPDVVDDPRFVLMTLDVDGYLADWRAGAKGGQDFWARADRFIAKKKRGEIKPVSRCWIVDADLIE